MHRNKGKSVSQCLKDRVDYAKNPEKTRKGILVTSYACAPETADVEFALSKREYRALTGRTQERDVIAYQFRQSFKPGEISAEEANQIGYEFAERFLKGNHAFIVATHVDRKHIHNHVIWNSTTLDCTRKFRDFRRSGIAAQKLSDMICVEHGKSIVEHPRRKGMSYDKWLGDRKKPPHRELLRRAIDAALEQKPKSMDALFSSLESAGYEIKHGKQPSFRKKGEGRFMRMDTLGEEYSWATLSAMIAGGKTHAPKRRERISHETQAVSLLIDVQAKLQEGKGAGYERWAKVFNAKQLAKTITYLSEHGFSSMDELRRCADEASQRVQKHLEENRQREQKIKDTLQLKAHVIHYMQTRDVFAEYKKSGYAKAFYEEHAAEILLHRETKRAFNELGLKKLPTIKSLQMQCECLQKEKRDTYEAYREARNEMRELLVVRENVERILRESPGDLENIKQNEQQR